MKRLVLVAFFALILMATLAVEPRAAQLPPDATLPLPATNDYAANILAGISNQGRTKQQPYVTAGDRTYLIGTQDGKFPDMGHHVPGEMGGLWLPPIKLIDGFQARIAEVGTEKEILLSESVEMVAYPYGNRFIYGRVLDDLDIERFQFSPDHQQGLIVQYSFKNASDRARRLRFEWSVKTDLRPGWGSERLGIRDGEDVVDWRPSDGVFMEYPWWFGTETYSLQVLMATGDFDLAKQTLRLLRSQSDKVNANGRIAHEITTDGQVVNRGNTQETAQFIMTIGKAFEWTGDRDFAREMYPAMKMGIDWLLGEMDQNRNLFPEGYGIMEVYGLNAELIDGAVYMQQALEAAGHIAGGV